MSPFLFLSDSVRESVGCIGGVFGLFVSLAFYLFTCFCLKLICKKAGKDPGILIWIPIVQIVPILQAARLELIWIVGMLIPGVNFFVGLFVAWKFVEAAGKPGWMGLLLGVPVVNILVLVYLAFGD